MTQLTSLELADALKQIRDKSSSPHRPNNRHLDPLCPKDDQCSNCIATDALKSFDPEIAELERQVLDLAFKIFMEKDADWTETSVLSEAVKSLKERKRNAV